MQLSKADKEELEMFDPEDSSQSLLMSSDKNMEIGKDSSFHPNNWTVRNIILFAGMIMIIILLGAIFVILVTDKYNDGSNLEEKYWEKYENQIKSSMDLNFNPCDNFFQYSCNGFLNDHDIPKDKSKISKMDVLSDENEVILQQIVTENFPIITPFYKKCMEIDERDLIDTKPLIPIITSINNLLNSENIVDDITALQYEFNTLGVHSFWIPYVEPGLYSPKQNMFSLSQGGTGLPTIEMYTDETDDAKKWRSLYHEQIALMMTLFLPNEDGVQYATRALKVETALAKVSTSIVDMRKCIECNYHNFTLNDLNGLTKSGVNWDNYFDLLGFDVEKLKKTGINVNQPDFVLGVSDLWSLAATDNETLIDIHAYFMWSLARGFAPFLGQDISNQAFQWYKRVNGVKSQPPLETVCVERTVDFLGDLIGHLFVLQKFDADSKMMMDNLVDNLIDSLKDVLGDTTWMDSVTKTSALEKLNMLHRKIGYPDPWPEYDDVHFEINDVHVDTVMFMNKRDFNKTMQEYASPPDPNSFGMPASMVNAYYNPSGNEIVFPAGILQSPLFNKDAPAPLNYGGIGSVIGHEITHGFDDNGRLFDGTGKYRDWWTPNSVKEFNSKATCISDFYEDYEPIPGFHINGKLTNGENIADIGGAKIGLNALRIWWEAFGSKELDNQFASHFNGLNHEQLYWVSFAQNYCGKYREEYMKNALATDPHSPPEYRAKGVTTLSPDFHEAFSCKTPKKSCSIW